MKNLPPEQQEQAKGILANAQGMVGGVAQAGGGAVKGVLDTAGNTVCSHYGRQDPSFGTAIID